MFYTFKSSFGFRQRHSWPSSTAFMTRSRTGSTRIPTEAWGYLPGDPLDPSPPDPSSCAFIDKLERPVALVYLFIFVTTIYALLEHRTAPEKLKRFILGLVFFTTTAIRCLSSYSGWTFGRNFSFLLFLSNSLGRAIWLWYLISLWF